MKALGPEKSAEVLKKHAAFIELLEIDLGIDPAEALELNLHAGDRQGLRALDDQVPGMSLYVLPQLGDELGVCFHPDDRNAPRQVERQLLARVGAQVDHPLGTHVMEGAD